MRTIMIIEDNPSLNRFYGKAFDRDDVSVVQAKNYAEAMQFLAWLKPDVIVLDLPLRDGDGIQVIKYLYERYGQNAVDFVVLSDSAQLMTSAKTLGIEVILKKPVGVVVLRDYVLSALNHRVVVRT